MKTKTKTKQKILKIFAMCILFLVSSPLLLAQNTLTNNANTQSVCVGTHPYEINPNVNSTYTWTILDQFGATLSPGVADISPVTATPPAQSSDSYIEVDFTIAGTYVLSVLELDANSCQGATVDLVITVNALPVVTANSTPSSPLCEGETLILNGGGATTYTWVDALGASYTDGSGFVQPVGTATYTVTGTDGNTCENTAFISVTVNPIPTPGPIWHN